MTNLDTLTDPASPEVSCGLWSQINADTRFSVSEDEVHYLRAVALAMDDDIASLLLLKKLKRARKLAAADLPPDLVVMNSFAGFTFAGDCRRFRQLVHPSACRTRFALSVASRLGAALIGLRAGDVVLWPDEAGQLRKLCVLAVDNERANCAPSRLRAVAT